MSNRKQWIMRSGEKIRIKDMTDFHLMNTIKFVERQHQEIKDSILCYFPNFQGEIAQEYAEREWDSWARGDHDDPAEVCPLYNDLSQEAVRRKIGERK